MPAFLDPSVYWSSYISQLMSFLLGQGLAAILPTRCFNTFGYIWSPNPGPFSMKEYVCITVMASSSSLGTYPIDVVLTQRVFYGQTIPLAFQCLVAIGSQCISFCVSGIICQLVVWLSNMIWPGVLANCVFFNTIHKNYSKHNPGQMTCEHFFYIAMASSSA